MLRTTLARLDHPAFRIFVGCYPNDRAVADVAAGDVRVVLVIGERPGPTTKADCLNNLWNALTRASEPADAIVLHDAEDVVHPAELRLFDALLDAHAAGLALRQIAFALVFPRNQPLTGAAWKGSGERRHTHRLLGEAQRMCREGYRTLLEKG